MSEDDRIDAMQRAYLAEMAQRRGYVLDFHRVLVAEDLDFMKAFNSFHDTVYANTRTLDKKTKEMVVIAALIAIGATPDHLRTHMKIAKTLGCTKTEVLELLELLMVPCGVPKFINGYESWAECFDVKRIVDDPAIPLV